jgi:hypothetical protein
MPPFETPKYRAAVLLLEKLGLVPSALQALSDAGSDAVYRECSRRGWVWNIDPPKWRKSKKPKSVPAAIVKSGFLEHALIRIVARDSEVNETIAEFSSIVGNFGYEIERVGVHSGRNAGEVLIYCMLHQNGANHE